MSAAVETARIEVQGDRGETLGTVSASVHAPSRSKATLVFAHGAGGTKDTKGLVSLGDRLQGSGVRFVRFNFLYAEKGKKSPDRQPALLAAWRSAASWASTTFRPKRLFLGGRSMGGRMASYLVADGYDCDGLVLLAYPLHPPGKPDRLRVDHLPRIRVPVLFVSGDRDSFARLDLLEDAVQRTKANLHLLSGADHGFKVPKKLGRTPDEVESEVAETVLDFLAQT